MGIVLSMAIYSVISDYCTFHVDIFSACWRFSGVARRRKVGGGTIFFSKTVKSKKGRRGVKAQDKVLWMGAL